MLTKKQRGVLEYITLFEEDKGYSPSLEDVRSFLNVSSTSTAHFHVSKLRENGYLPKKGFVSSSPVSPIRMIEVPLLGIVAAGHPIEAIKDERFVMVPADKVPTTANLFALRVAGDSMQDEQIDDGDTVVIKRQATAENGEKVIALIDNDNVTLKTYRKTKAGVSLLPANKNYEPIIIRKDDSFAIQGVLVSVVKSTDFAFPNTEVKPQTQKMQVAEKSISSDLSNAIICGDALEELKRMPTSSFDAIIIDPPYNIGKDFGNDSDRRELNDYISWSKEWIKESERLLKPGGTMFIYGFSEILAHLSVEVSLPKRWLIWHYTNKNVASSRFWQRSHESIICAWKDTPIFNRDAVREPYTETFLNNAAGKVRAGTVGRFGKDGKETVYNAHVNGALPRDVLKFPALAGGAGVVERWFLCRTCDSVYAPKEIKAHREHDIVKHPTQKPLELTKKLLKSCLPEHGGRVLIPFAGSGSECVAAKGLGATYVGIELNPEYVRLAEGFLKGKTS